MKKNFKLGIIGAGFMSTAIVKGVVSSKVLLPEEIIVSDLNTDALAKIKEYNVCTTSDSCFLADNSNFILFAVKPQNIDSVLSVIKECDCNKFISIMAGVKKNKIKKVFPNSLVARCMPNTPCSIACGAIGLDCSDYSNIDDIKFINDILGSLACVVSVDEKQMHAVTGVSGSSPAYFYMFLDGIIKAGVKHGLTYEEAKLLATNTMIGAGQMVLANPDKSIDELINAVCSKGGTTIEAVNVYKKEELEKTTINAVDACVKRSVELGKL